jgi:sugar phosphate isomerase/epimerase
MKLGCSTILYGKLPLETALGGIQRAGFHAIELCAIPGMAPHVSPDLDADQRKTVKETIASYGLAIESIGASGNLDLNDPTRFKAVLQLAKDLGAPAVTSGSGGKYGDEASYQQFLEVVKDDLIPVAKDLGVKLSFKAHVGNSVCNRATILRFAGDVDLNWAGVNIDPSHLWRTDPDLLPEETIRACAKAVTTGRIRDTREHDAPVGPPEKQVPGGGCMNLPAIIQAYREATKLDYVVVEIVGAHAWGDAFKVQRVVEACACVLQPMLEG